MIFEYILSGVLILYALLIFVSAYGLMKFISTPDIKLSEGITLIVPVRNEQYNIDLFFEILHKINCLNLKIVFVDDFSEDRTYDIINEKIKSLSYDARIIHNLLPGKKQAIITAVKEVVTDKIMITDIDCRLSTDTVYLMADALKNGNDLVCGPVLIQQDSSFFSKIQYYDQLSLTATAAGMANLGLPFMCSAANMGFLKKAFVELQPYTDNLNIHTGDDVFLLEKFTCNRKKITWLFSGKSIVYTQPQSTLAGFFRQRIRWAQKAKRYKNFFALLISYTVFLINALLLFCLLILPFYTFLWYITAKYLLAKAVIDILFLFLAAYKLQVKFNPLYAWCSFFFHMAYVPVAAVASQVVNTTWKGRRVEQNKHD